MAQDEHLNFVGLWERPDLIEQTAHLLNSHWKRPLSARVVALQKSVAATRLTTNHWSTAAGTAHFILIQKQYDRSTSTDKKKSAAIRHKGKDIIDNGIDTVAISNTNTSTGATSCDTSISAASSSSNESLRIRATSREVVVGHGQLKLASRHRQVGKACVAFSVIVDASFRRRGLGRCLLTRLEGEVKKANFSFLYLYAAPKLARDFYGKLGYKCCDAMTVKRKVFKSLKTEQLEGIEGIFARASRKYQDSYSEFKSQKVTMDDECRIANRHHENDHIPMNQPATTEKNINLIVGRPSQGSGHTRNIWLRKRLTNNYFRSIKTVTFERICAVHDIAEQYVRSQCSEVVGNMYEQDHSTKLHCTRCWCGAMDLMSHFKQIGPSCGLCAIAMAVYHVPTLRTKEKCADSLKSSKNIYSISPSRMERITNLFAEAQRRGFTTDGELFDIQSVCDLANWSIDGVANARQASHLSQAKCKVRNTASIFPEELIAAFCNRNKNCSKSVFIVPYDSKPGNCEPCLSKGRCAHYAVVVGVIFQVESAVGNLICDSNIYWIDSKLTNELQDMLLNVSADRHKKNLWIIFQHSASKRPVITKWSNLVASNAQLTHAISTKSSWIVPEDGPQLKGKCIQVDTVSLID